MEILDTSSLIVGTSYKTQISFREYLNGKDSAELYVIDDLQQPFSITPKIHLLGLSDLNTKNKAPSLFKVVKNWLTKKNDKTVINQWYVWAFRRFFLNFKVRYRVLYKYFRKEAGITNYSVRKFLKTVLVK